MSTEDNKAITRRFLEEVGNQGNLSAFDQLIAADAIDHNPSPGIPPGREGIKQFFTMFRSAFPDLHFTVEDMIAEGDKVVVRYTWRGTQQGAFMDIAPTHKQVTISSIDILRFANGKAVEHWGSTDNLGLLQQLGVIPAPGQVVPALASGR